MMFVTAAFGLPLLILNLVAAIIYYIVNRSKGRFVHFHTLQSLYSLIPVNLLKEPGSAVRTSGDPLWWAR